MGRDYIRYGILGYGRFAERRIAPSLRSCRHSRLVAIQKRDVEAAREKAEAAGIPKWYGSVEELVADPEIDAVFVASANALHYEQTLVAARAGKHVLVEKPMAVSAAQCEEMVQVCRSAGVKLGVGHNMRYTNAVRWLRQLVQSGELGRVASVTAVFHVVADPKLRTWVFDGKLAGGGAFADLGVHLVDAVRFVLGEELQQIRAFLRKEQQGREVEIGVSVLGATGSGALVRFDTWFELPFRTELVLYGTQKAAGIVRFDAPERAGLVFEDVGDGKRELRELPPSDPYREEIDRFSLAVLSGVDPDIPGEEGLANQHILDAVYDVAVEV